MQAPPRVCWFLVRTDRQFGHQETATNGRFTASHFATGQGVQFANK